MRLYPISGHIKYAHFADSSDLQIDIGLLPENSMELQEITLPPFNFSSNGMFKTHSAEEEKRAEEEYHKPVPKEEAIELLNTLDSVKILESISK